MKRLVCIALGLSLLGVIPTLAGAETLPGGTSLTVDIATPVTGASVVAGTLPITGTASIGEGAAAKDTTIVYVIDVSGSTNDSAGVNCDANPGNDSILRCEKEAVKAVNAAAALPTSPVLNSGIVAFSGAGTTAAYDFDPGLPVQLLVPPGAAIDTAVESLGTSSGTSFVAAINAAMAVLAASTATHKTVVFLSDGDDTVGGSLPGAGSLNPTVVRAFAVGTGASCSSGTPSLNAVAALGASPASTCTNVTDPSTLPGLILTQSTGSSLTSLALTVNGVATPATFTITAPPSTPLPVAGPATVSFSTSVALPITANYQICVVATGTDSGGTGTAQDCTDVQVVDVVVTCVATATCTATAVDPGVATATFRGTGLDKTVGLRDVDTAPLACAGANCVTAFDVLFPGGGPATGRAELLVVTEKAVSTPFWKASVYIDDVKVTRSCLYNVLTRVEVLPCKIIGPTLQGGTFYYVKFVADPLVKFR
jgi:trimeric autotransporter adhesin